MDRLPNKPLSNTRTGPITTFQSCDVYYWWFGVSYYRRLRQAVLREQGLEFSAGPGMTNDLEVTRNVFMARGSGSSIQGGYRRRKYASDQLLVLLTKTRFLKE